jgi:hypothetical protein
MSKTGDIYLSSSCAKLRDQNPNNGTKAQQQKCACAMLASHIHASRSPRISWIPDARVQIWGFKKAS